MIFYKRADKYKQSNQRGGKAYEHVAIAEKALGHRLPASAEIHHVNEDKSDNRPENLVICPSAKYHALLHLRMRAVAAGCPPHYRMCSVCKEYDDPANMYVKPNGNHPGHRACRAWARLQ